MRLSLTFLTYYSKNWSKLIEKLWKILTKQTEVKITFSESLRKNTNPENIFKLKSCKWQVFQWYHSQSCTMIISVGENWLNKKTSWVYSSSPTKGGRNKNQNNAKKIRKRNLLKLFQQLTDFFLPICFIKFCMIIKKNI